MGPYVLEGGISSYLSASSFNARMLFGHMMLTMERLRDGGLACVDREAGGVGE